MTCRLDPGWRAKLWRMVLLVGTRTVTLRGVEPASHCTVNPVVVVVPTVRLNSNQSVAVTGCWKHRFSCQSLRPALERHTTSGLTPIPKSVTRYRMAHDFGVGTSAKYRFSLSTASATTDVLTITVATVRGSAIHVRSNQHKHTRMQPWSRTDLESDMSGGKGGGNLANLNV